MEPGMFLDANDEIEKIGPEVRHVPEILTVRVQIYRAREKWPLMQTAAKKLTEIDPQKAQWWISRAYAKHRADSIEAAKHILLDAWKPHEKWHAFALHYRWMTMGDHELNIL